MGEPGRRPTAARRQPRRGHAQMIGVLGSWSLVLVSFNGRCCCPSWRSVDPGRCEGVLDADVGRRVMRCGMCAPCRMFLPTIWSANLARGPATRELGGMLYFAVFVVLALVVADFRELPSRSVR